MQDILVEGLRLAHQRYERSQDPIIPIILHHDEIDYLQVIIIPKEDNQYTAKITFLPKDVFDKSAQDHQSNLFHLHLDHEKIAILT